MFKLVNDSQIFFSVSNQEERAKFTFSLVLSPELLEGVKIWCLR